MISVFFIFFFFFKILCFLFLIFFLQSLIIFFLTHCLIHQETVILFPFFLACTLFNYCNYRHNLSSSIFFPCFSIYFSFHFPHNSPFLLSISAIFYHLPPLSLSIIYLCIYLPLISWKHRITLPYNLSQKLHFTSKYLYYKWDYSGDAEWISPARI